MGMHGAGLFPMGHVCAAQCSLIFVHLNRKSGGVRCKVERPDLSYTCMYTAYRQRFGPLPQAPALISYMQGRVHVENILPGSP